MHWSKSYPKQGFACNLSQVSQLLPASVSPVQREVVGKHTLCSYSPHPSGAV